MKDVTKRRTTRHAPLAKQIEDDKVNKKRVRTGKLAKDEEEEDITEEVRALPSSSPFISFPLTSSVHTRT
jgi:hypothetical protein